MQTTKKMASSPPSKWSRMWESHTSPRLCRARRTSQRWASIKASPWPPFYSAAPQNLRFTEHPLLTGHCVSCWESDSGDKVTVDIGWSKKASLGGHFCLPEGRQGGSPWWLWRKATGAEEQAMSRMSGVFPGQQGEQQGRSERDSWWEESARAWGRQQRKEVQSRRDRNHSALLYEWRKGQKPSWRAEPRPSPRPVLPCKGGQLTCNLRHTGTHRWASCGYSLAFSQYWFPQHENGKDHLLSAIIWPQKLEILIASAKTELKCLWIITFLFPVYISAPLVLATVTCRFKTFNLQDEPKAGRWQLSGLPSQAPGPDISLAPIV